MSESYGYNIGFEVCNAYNVFFEHKESQLNELIDKISGANSETRIIKDLINKLAHAKRDKQLDFSHDDELMDLIDHVHERNSTVFGQKRCVFKDEADIDVILQGLDAELKMLAAELNEHMMNVNNKYEDRSQMTESARQVVKEADEHIKSILHKIRG